MRVPITASIPKLNGSFSDRPGIRIMSDAASSQKQMVRMW